MISLLIKWYARNRAYRQVYRELNALTNRQLDDLGLTRGCIDQVARESAYGKEAVYV